MRQRQIVNTVAKRCVRCKCPVAIVIHLDHTNQNAVIRNADVRTGFASACERWRGIVGYAVITDQAFNGTGIVSYFCDYRGVGGKRIDNNLPTVRHAAAARTV
ncbi:hypothetical protein SDC9_160387 [bioreactor metagenome]|uniref:Uncharacterized protein n=1 Tax=bioreactor metagenome TaxID=1076179 RepID=A0A645FFH1_9ZZZZ